MRIATKYTIITRNKKKKKKNRELANIHETGESYLVRLLPPIAFADTTKHNVYFYLWADAFALTV